MDGSGAPDRDIHQPKLLKDICIHVLEQNHDALGDVGWHILPDQLRRIMRPCSRGQLETIEDSTLEGSGRDLTWYTWHLWHKVFVQRYGVVREDTELTPLPGEQPMDYEPPQGIKFPQADYRVMIMQREESEVARKAAAIQKLRGSYQVEAKKRALAGTDFTTKLPPAKRGRFSAIAQQQKAQAAALAHKTLGGKPAVKVLIDLGLKKSNLIGRNGSSSSSVGCNGRVISRSSSSRPGCLAVKPAPPKQQQQSALACLARDQAQRSAAAVAVAPSVAAAGTGASGGRLPGGLPSKSIAGGGSSNRRETVQVRALQQKQQQQQQQQRQQQQLQQQQLQRQRQLSSPSGKAQSLSAVKHNSNSNSSTATGFGLLDTPVTLAAAGRSPVAASKSPLAVKTPLAAQQAAVGGIKSGRSVATGRSVGAQISRKVASLEQQRQLGW